MFTRMKGIPKYIITRNGNGNLCAVNSQQSMSKNMTGCKEFGDTKKLLPEIEWPQAWKPVKDKDGTIKFDTAGTLYLWNGRKWTRTNSICGSALSSIGGAGIYCLEYIGTPKNT